LAIALVIKIVNRSARAWNYIALTITIVVIHAIGRVVIVWTIVPVVRAVIKITRTIVVVVLAIVPVIGTVIPACYLGGGYST
jgi:hypothetical protein